MDNGNFYRELGNALADEAADEVRELLGAFMLTHRGVYDRCESPIECRMFMALFGVVSLRHKLHVAYLECDVDWDHRHQSDPCFGKDATVIPQAHVGKYRADFLVRIGDVHGGAWMVIECDGHDFHERTKEQARRDKARDRWMVSQGILVLRFTGSEIWADAMLCAEAVVDTIYEESHRKNRAAA